MSASPSPSQAGSEDLIMSVTLNVLTSSMLAVVPAFAGATLFILVIGPGLHAALGSLDTVAAALGAR